MKKLINWVLNILIIVVILAIAYLLWQNYQMKKVEKDNTAAALETYEEVTCSNDTVEADTSNPQITNEEADPNQIIGYILSGDPTYVTNYNNARSLIRKLERDEILEELLKSYLDLNQK